MLYGNGLNATRAFVVTFNADMTNSVASVSNITASVSYSHKRAQKDFSLGMASVLSFSLKINNVNEKGNALTGIKIIGSREVSAEGRAKELLGLK